MFFSISLFLKKIKYYKKYYLAGYLFLILPFLFLFVSFAQFFTNYYQVFQNTIDSTIGPSIRIRGSHSVPDQTQARIRDQLSQFGFQGYLLKKRYTLEKGVELADSISLPNETFPLTGLQFSSENTRSRYSTNHLPLVEGSWPQDSSELLISDIVAQKYSLGLHTRIQVKLGTSFNFTIVGILSPIHADLNSIDIPNNRPSAYFLFRDNDESFWQNISTDEEDFEYRFFFDHRRFDVFNLHHFEAQFHAIQTNIEGILRNSQVDGNLEVVNGFHGISRTSTFQNLILDSIFGMIQICLMIAIVILFIGQKALNFLVERLEIPHFERIVNFWSPSRVKRQLAMELLITGLVSYVICLTLSYACVFWLDSLYVPSTFFYITGAIWASFFLLFSVATIKTTVFQRSLRGGVLQFRRTQKTKRRKRIGVILIILCLIPLGEVLFERYYIGTSSDFSNFIFAAIVRPLSSFIIFFYPILVFAAMFFLLKDHVIKLIQKIVSKWFQRDKKQKALSPYMEGIIQHKRAEILSIVMISSLCLVFMNYFGTIHENEYFNAREKIFFEVGGDIKILDEQTSPRNISSIISPQNYCVVEGSDGEIQIYQKNRISGTVVKFSPQKFEYVLNWVCQEKTDGRLFQMISQLQIGEVIMPEYCAVSFGLDIGDTITFFPQDPTGNQTSLEFTIKWFYDFLPGIGLNSGLTRLDRTNYHNYVICSPNLTFSTPTGQSNIRRTYLIKDESNATKLLVDAFFSDLYHTRRIYLTSSLREFDETDKTTINHQIAQNLQFFCVFFCIETSILVIYFFRNNVYLWNLLQIQGISQGVLYKNARLSTTTFSLVSLLIGLLGLLSGFFVTFLLNSLFLGFYLYPFSCVPWSEWHVLNAGFVLGQVLLSNIFVRRRDFKFCFEQLQSAWRE